MTRTWKQWVAEASPGWALKTVSTIDGYLKRLQRRLKVIGQPLLIEEAKGMRKRLVFIEFALKRMQEEREGG